MLANVVWDAAVGRDSHCGHSSVHGSVRTSLRAHRAAGARLCLDSRIVHMGRFRVRVGPRSLGTPTAAKGGLGARPLGAWASRMVCRRRPLEIESGCVVSWTPRRLVAPERSHLA